MKTKIKFILTIKTNNYVGTFERELVSYCFGWDSGLIDETFREAFKKEEGDIDLHLLNFYNEHGDTCCAISGNSNDLLVYFSQNPQKYFDLIKRRLLAFPRVYSKFYEYDRKIKIKWISLSEEVTTEKLILEEKL